MKQLFDIDFEHQTVNNEEERNYGAIIDQVICRRKRVSREENENYIDGGACTPFEEALAPSCVPFHSSETDWHAQLALFDIPLLNVWRLQRCISSPFF